MLMVGLLRRGFLLTFLMLSGLAWGQQQATVVKYQIHQLKIQLTEIIQQKKQFEELLDQDDKNNVNTDVKSEELQNKISSAKIELDTCQKETPDSCQELKNEVKALELKFSNLLAANYQNDIKLAQRQNTVEQTSEKISMLDRQIILLKKQIEDKNSILNELISKPVPSITIAERKIDKKPSQQETTVQKLEIKTETTAIKMIPETNTNTIPGKLKIKLEKDSAELGIRDGKKDAIELIKILAIQKAREDGERDGEQMGKELASQSSYDQGFKHGQREGMIQAKSMGEMKGKIEGFQQGLQEAANRDAKKQAIFDVDESNIVDQAERKGQVLGRDKAREDGYRIGKAKGEAHAIDKFENRSLTPIYVDGPFMGSFSPRTPEYPEVLCQQEECPAKLATLENIKNNYLDPQLRKVFLDSYQNSYDQSHRQEFLEKVDLYYLPEYTNTLNASLSYFSQLPQEDAYQKGLQEGLDQALDLYIRVYSVDSRNKSYQESLGNPDKKNPIYQKTYLKAYKENKKIHWNNIFNQNREKAETKTYDSLIDTEIIKAKSIRYGEVSDLYERFPVISFEYSSMSEIGIDGIGEKDGIFQPGENLSHDFILRNYGLRDAHDIIVVTDGTHRFKIDKLPASTEMHLKGMVKSVIPSNLDGESFSPTLEVYFENASQQKIVKHHYENPNENLLGSKVQRPLQIRFPLKAEITNWDKELVLGETKLINLRLKNSSKKQLSGEFIIQFDSNASETLEGGTISLSLEPGQTIETVLPMTMNLDQDLYQDLFVEGFVSLNQVVIGNTDKMPVLLKSNQNQHQTEEKEIILITAGDRSQPLISQLMTASGKSFSIKDNSLAKKADNKLSFSNKSLILIHENENDLNRNFLTKLALAGKGNNVLLIKNSQVEVALPKEITFSLNLNSLDQQPLMITLHKENEHLLPLLVVTPEIATRTLKLSTFLAQEWNKIDIHNSDREFLSIKLLLSLVEKESLPLTFRSLVKNYEKLDFQIMDGTQISQVYLKLKNELQVFFDSIENNRDSASPQP